MVVPLSSLPRLGAFVEVAAKIGGAIAKFCAAFFIVLSNLSWCNRAMRDATRKPA
jgi:hypothetical protein